MSMPSFARVPVLAVLFTLALSTASRADQSVTLNCWNDFPVQSNTVNGGPFRDSRQGSCPLDTNYVRVVEGQLDGYCEATFTNLSPLSCFDVIFQYLNDGEDAGRIDISANGRPLGTVVGSGHHDLERCDTVTFYNVDLYTTQMTIRIEFHELSPTQFRHNGAVSLTFRPSQRQPIRLQVSGEPTPGGLLTFDMQADPNCEALLGYYLAGARSASTGTPLPDGRVFPLDNPLRVGRGTLDLNARARATFRVPPQNPHVVGRTYHFAYLTFLPPGTEAGTVGRVSEVLTVTVLPR